MTDANIDLIKQMEDSPKEAIAGEWYSNVYRCLTAAIRFDSSVSFFFLDHAQPTTQAHATLMTDSNPVGGIPVAGLHRRATFFRGWQD